MEPISRSRDHHSFPDVAFFAGCRKCVDIVEPYHPKKVLRQFGQVQIILSPIPPAHSRRRYSSKQYRLSYNSVDHFWERWRSHILSKEERSVPVTYQWEAID